MEAILATEIFVWLFFYLFYTLYFPPKWKHPMPINYFSVCNLTLLPQYLFQFYSDAKVKGLPVERHIFSSGCCEQMWMRWIWFVIDWGSLTKARQCKTQEIFAHFICFNIFLITATTHFDIALPQNPLYTAVPKGASIRFLGVSWPVLTTCSPPNLLQMRLFWA